MEEVEKIDEVTGSSGTLKQTQKELECASPTQLARTIQELRAENVLLYCLVGELVYVIESVMHDHGEYDFSEELREARKVLKHH